MWFNTQLRASSGCSGESDILTGRPYAHSRASNDFYLPDQKRLPMSAPPDSNPPSPADEVRAMARQTFGAGLARPGLKREVPKQKQQAAERRRKRYPFRLIAVLALMPVACAAWMVSGYHPREAPAAQAAGGDPLADEAALLAANGPGMQVYRLTPAPEIRVLLFSSLTLQGRTLNRIGAFVEKAGMPRDRVVDDAELNRAIANGHDSVET